MPTQPDDPELMTGGDVAALLFVDPKTVTRWAAAGKLVAIRTPGGHRRYRKSDVVAILAGFGGRGVGLTAAEEARRARGRAADIAAQTVADDAIRAATLVEVRAGVVAAHIKDAADRAVAALIRDIHADTVTDVVELGRRLSATTRSVADAAARESRRAAAEIAAEVAAAAYRMTRTVAAAEAEFDEPAPR